MAKDYSTARKLSNRFGGIHRHEIDGGKENTVGYWVHIHPKNAIKAHIWYFSKVNPNR